MPTSSWACPEPRGDRRTCPRRRGHATQDAGHATRQWEGGFRNGTSPGTPRPSGLRSAILVRGTPRWSSCARREPVGTVMDIAKLALEDGTVYTGRAFGARGEVDGEVVFNTSMTGYQEILTDPSYNGQIVTMTYPLIGNYGVNLQDVESGRPWVRGFIVRELSRLASNHRSENHLDGYLAEHGIPGIEGVDTRKIVRQTRRAGALKGILSSVDFDDDRLVAKARSSPGMVGRDLTQEVMPAGVTCWDRGFESDLVTKSPEEVAAVNGSLRRPHVVALDFGMKWNILRHLVEIGCKVTVMPGTATAEEILERAARRDLPLERTGRPRRLVRRHEHTPDPVPHRRRGARDADLRHLPGPSAPGTGLRRPDLQAQVRPPRRQPPRPERSDRPHRDHDPEPWLRRRSRDAPRRRGPDPRQPE